MGRRDARDIAFKLVFAYTFDKQQNDDILNEYTASVDVDDCAYITEVYHGIINHFDELESEVAKTSEKFDKDRIFKVDFVILILALYEIKFMESIPFKVSVDEAILLAEKYSTQKSGKYINGILSKFAR